MKERIGWVVFIAGLLVAARWLWLFMWHKFQNDHLTETQLLIFNLNHWVNWVPAFIAIGIGLVLINSKGNE